MAKVSRFGAAVRKEEDIRADEEERVERARRLGSGLDLPEKKGGK